jgi:hypothetical protein
VSEKCHYVRCTVTGNALAKSRDKGTPSVKISLATVPKDGEPSRDLWCDLWITPATQERTIETLEKALDWHGESFRELNEPILSGKEVVAVCSYEEDYNGHRVEKVSFLNSTKREVKKADPLEVRDIAAAGDGFLKLARAGKPRAPKAEKPAAPPTESSDDLPF